jgi:predicted NAD-dependent protein-ADP-ribosyltransferase YbiA (DUF1768 family)
MSDTSDILFYDQKEPYYEFSNYYQRSVTIDDIEYLSTEVYYQAAKFTNTSPSYADMIRSVNTSNKARYLAQQKVQGGYSAAWYVSASNRTLLNDIIRESLADSVTLREDWDAVKDDVMRKAVCAKFTQHDDLRELLIGTNDAQIIENSPRDAYWGNGSDGTGKNRLGEILMEIRTLIDNSDEEKICSILYNTDL